MIGHNREKRPMPRAAQSNEFVAEVWGRGEAAIWRFAPVTRSDGRVWVHAAQAHEETLEEMQGRAVRIWRVVGSLWNPREFLLVWRRPSWIDWGPCRNRNAMAS